MSAESLAETVQFGRELRRERPDATRDEIVSWVRDFTNRRGEPNLIVDAMAAIWPANGQGGPAHFPEQKPRHSFIKSKKDAAPTKHKKLLRRTASPSAVPERDKNFRYEWQRGFCAVQDTSRETGLPATTRLVLWTVAAHMNADGTGAHVGQERIAREAGITLPAAKFHAQLAVDRGWLKRTRTYRSRFGLGYEYVAAIPEEGATSLPGNVSSRKPHASKGAT